MLPFLYICKITVFFFKKKEKIARMGGKEKETILFCCSTIATGIVLSAVVPRSNHLYI